ncbi:MAG: hypothetical protein LBD84_07080 [Campylobacteraceae bacterium]|nr:hypothetical protein [Campylobacteraceae bacterium]
MLKINGVEIPTDGSVNVNENECTKVTYNGDTVWEKVTNNPNPIWSGDSVIYIDGDTPRIGIFRSQDSKGVTLQYASMDNNNYLTFTSSGFTGMAVMDWENIYTYGFANSFQIKPNSGNKWKIDLLANYYMDNPFFGGVPVVNTLVYDLSTNKFSGKLEAVFADGDGAMTAESIGIHSTSDGGIRIVYGWCENDVDFTYFYGDTIYLR